jgi:ribosome-binding protein aMBF1 (putative translation factor)
MYTISKVMEGIILTCQDCAHIERVSQFNLSLGSQRTQAAQAMQAHSRHEHDMEPLLELLPNKYEVLASAAVSRHSWVCDR